MMDVIATGECWAKSSQGQGCQTFSRLIINITNYTDEELENGSNSEAEKMTSSSPSMASTGLSVVRPEVLFGQAGGGGMPDFGKMMMGIGGQQVRNMLSKSRNNSLLSFSN